MNDLRFINPYGLPVPSQNTPEPRYIPGPSFENARVDHWANRHQIILAVEGHYFSKSIFHMLKEYRDWEGLFRGDVSVIGRVVLDDKFLDLLVMDPEDGYLRASSICLQEIKALHPDIQHFLNQQFDAPPILTREIPWGMVPRKSTTVRKAM